MKKILAALLVLAFTASSCTQNMCPTYAKNDKPAHRKVTTIKYR